MALASCDGQEVCAICGDENASRHYGVTACFGCKGFFRRSVKAGLKYICQFDGQCTFDKGKRNTCRFCRFERCLKTGMSTEAIRPDRDSTGKQLRPRKCAILEQRKYTAQSSSTSAKRNRFAQKTLLLQLMNLEYSINMGKVQKTTVNACDQVVSANQFTLSEVLDNPESVDSERTQIRYDAIRTASADDITASIRRSLISTIDWVNGIGAHFGVVSTAEKLALLNSRAVLLALFSVAARTSQSTTNPDAFCLPLGCSVKRYASKNVMVQTLVSRILDDLIAPLNRLSLDEREIVAFKAIIALNPDAVGLSPTTARSVAAYRDRVLHALFQNISDQFLTNGAASRFANILTLLPALTDISSLITNYSIIESLFGSGVDSLLVELLGQNRKKHDDATKMRQYSMRRSVVDKVTQTDNLLAAKEEYFAQADSRVQTKVCDNYCKFATPSPDPLSYYPSSCGIVSPYMEQTSKPSYYCQQLPILDYVDLHLQ
uniref:Uncharacterized protein n=1 Tax=Plectus sambesii TaxID=2011161 RepID=A0A914X6M8_9BILA